MYDEILIIDIERNVWIGGRIYVWSLMLMSVLNKRIFLNLGEIPPTEADICVFNQKNILRAFRKFNKSISFKKENKTFACFYIIFSIK